MTISFNDFKKIELKVATIKEATRIEGSDKLLKLTLEIGSETRTIVGGIGKSYAPEAIIGKQIIIVANLEPRALMGIESQGMLLAVHDDTGGLSLLQTDKPVPSGSLVG